MAENNISEQANRLLQQLHEPDYNVRQGAINQIVANYREEAIPTLVAWLDNPKEVEVEDMGFYGKDIYTLGEIARGALYRMQIFDELQPLLLEKIAQQPNKIHANALALLKKSSGKIDVTPLIANYRHAIFYQGLYATNLREYIQGYAPDAQLTTPDVVPKMIEAFSKPNYIALPELAKQAASHGKNWKVTSLLYKHCRHWVHSDRKYVYFDDIKLETSAYLRILRQSVTLSSNRLVAFAAMFPTIRETLLFLLFAPIIILLTPLFLIVFLWHIIFKPDKKKRR